MIQIVFCGDNAVSRPIGVAIRSLLETSQGEDYHVTVLALGWNQASLSFLQRASGSRPTRIIEVFNQDLPPVKSGRHVTSAAYLLFQIPDILDSMPRAIYLDGDILIRSSLRSLWNTPLDQMPVGACQSGTVPYIASPGGIPDWRQLALDPRAPVFNSGVLLMDLDEWRRQDIGRQAMDFAYQNGARMPLADQAALNAVLQGRWKRLNCAWNATRGVFEDHKGMYAILPTDEVNAARTHPRIVHFTGSKKPWNQAVDRPYVDDWRRLSISLGWTPWRERQPLSLTARRVLRSLRNRRS